MTVKVKQGVIIAPKNIILPLIKFILNASYITQKLRSWCVFFNVHVLFILR